MIAHQKLRKTEMAAEEAGSLFGNWSHEININIDKAECREITLTQAAALIENYEYLGTMCNAPRVAFGIFFENNLGGCVVFASPSPPSVATSIIDPPHSDRVIQLARGCSVHWSHPHTSSKLIGYALREVERLGFRIAVAYSDPAAGEVGTVYQATNWLYCGQTKVASDFIRHDGVRVQFNFKGAAEKFTALGMKRELRTRKHRYIHLLGNKREQRAIRAALKWPIEAKYPKR